MAYWPGMVNKGSISMELTATYDIFTTMINIANATQYLPNDGRIYDGQDMSDIIFNLNGGKSKHECIYIYRGTPNATNCPYNGTQYGICQGLWAVRCGQYKAHWVTSHNGSANSILQDPPLLYNVNWDPSEKHPIWPNNDQYGNIINYLTQKRDDHLQTINVSSIVIQQLLGTNPDNAFCGCPNSEEIYPSYPNCTCHPENFNAPVCNPVCYDTDGCGPDYPGNPLESKLDYNAIHHIS